MSYQKSDQPVSVGRNPVITLGLQLFIATNMFHSLELSVFDCHEKKYTNLKYRKNFLDFFPRKDMHAVSRGLRNREHADTILQHIIL